MFWTCLQSYEFIRMYGMFGRVSWVFVNIIRTKNWWFYTPAVRLNHNDITRGMLINKCTPNSQSKDGVVNNAKYNLSLFMHYPRHGNNN